MLEFATWNITKECNLKCKHCFNSGKFFTENGGELRDMTTDEAISTVHKLARQGLRELNILGGEPLLRSDLIPIIQESSACNIDVSMSTNGILMSKEYAETLCAIGVKEVTISIDGITQETCDFIRGNGTFERALRAVRLLVEAAKGTRTEISICFVATAVNLHEMSQLADFCEGLSVDALNVVWLFDAGRAVDNHSKLSCSLEDRLKSLEVLAADYASKPREWRLQLDTRPRFAGYLQSKYGRGTVYVREAGIHCQAGERSITIEPDGQLIPCGVMNIPDSTTHSSSGDRWRSQGVFVQDLQELGQAMESPGFRSFVRYRTAHLARLHCCQDCDWEQVCCLCALKEYAGGTNPECEITRQKEEQWFQEVLNSIPHRLSIKERYVNGRLEILDPQLSVYRTVEGVGEAIWRQIDDRRSLKQICEDMYGPYEGEVSFSIFCQDVAKFICELRSDHFVSLPPIPDLPQQRNRVTMVPRVDKA